MRPRNQTARDRLVAALSRQAAASAPDLAAQLDISVATLHRLLQEIAGNVITTGRARRTRYALRRPLRGDVADLPLYEVGVSGRAEHLSHLALVHPHGTCMSLEGTGWPLPDESRDGWWSGLPYPLCDMRPQGYMGRQLARAEHRQLAVPENPELWSDDDVLHVLGRIGSDMSGNLILGDVAYERWQADKVSAAEPVKARSLGSTYARLAAQAIAGGVAGSSAAGEFPKFSALRDLAGSATPHALVKFSGAEASAAMRRWSDLLVCEHLALECVAGLAGVESARSRVVMHEGRTFLEVERFDRHGRFGRSRLCSLAVLDAALLGAGSSDWTQVATRLAAAKLIGPDDVARIEHLWWFGRLIANTDMHAGNLSFRPNGSLTLAPAYDMLPMLYAPLTGGEVPLRSFEPPLPLPPQRAVWSAACAAALSFWQRAAADVRIGAAFRRLCAANAKRLQQAAEHV